MFSMAVPRVSRFRTDIVSSAFSTSGWAPVEDEPDRGGFLARRAGSPIHGSTLGFGRGIRWSFCMSGCRGGILDLFGVGDVPDSGATFSSCRTWRYVLWRTWGSAAPAVFIGLNPSTADETEDDPTIRRCIGYAQAWGAGGLRMLNLYGIRSTDPRPVFDGSISDPVGPDNNRHILGESMAASVVVAAWGAFPGAVARGDRVAAMLGCAGVRLHVLRLTKGGCPAHPLYLPRGLVPIPWR